MSISAIQGQSVVFNSSVDTNGEIETRNKLKKSDNDEVKAGASAMTSQIISGIVNKITEQHIKNTGIDLDAPSPTSKQITAKVKSELLKILKNQVKGDDIDTVNKLVKFISTVAGENLANMLNVKVDSTNHTKKNNIMIPQNSSMARARSQDVVDGGTDIVDPAPTSSLPSAAPSPTPPSRSFYSNVMGDFKILDALTLILSALNKQQANNNKLAAQWSKTAVDAAVAAGNHAIDAAKQQMTGAITAGVASLTMQGGATASTVKSLHTESKSITNNLKKANETELAISQQRSAVMSSQDNMISEGRGGLKPEVEAVMTEAEGKHLHQSNTHRNKHKEVENNTSRVRVVADLTNTAARTVHGVTEGTFGVNASQDNSEAETSRAHQTVDSAVDNTLRDSAKKDSEVQSELRQTLSNILSNQNDTASYIATHMG